MSCQHHIITHDMEICEGTISQPIPTNQLNKQASEQPAFQITNQPANLPNNQPVHPTNSTSSLQAYPAFQ